MRAYMKEEMAALKSEAERCAAVTKHKHPVPAVMPLHDQLRRMLVEMPQLQRQRSWSIYELVSQLQGRYRQHPHPQHVARELRALGWTSARVWSSIGYGKRIWHPPITAVKNGV
jgi:hypothetical protein